MKTSFKSLLSSGKKIVGTWTDGNSNTLIEVAGMVGFDFIIIDNEHGCHNNPNFVDMIRTAESADIVPIVRVPGPQLEDPIKKVLDMGASGILVPNVYNREDVERVVRYSRFAPVGKRGCCPYLRSNNYALKYGTVDYYEKANEEVTVILLIENKEAVENIDDILDVTGIDSLLFGRVDMSVSMGIPGQLTHSKMLAAVEKVTEKAHRKGIPVGMVGFGTEDTARWANSGEMDYVTVGGDIGTLIAAYQADLKVIRNKGR